MRYFILLSVALFTLAFIGCNRGDDADVSTTGGEPGTPGGTLDKPGKGKPGKGKPGKMGKPGTEFVTVTVNANLPEGQKVVVVLDNNEIVHLQKGECVKVQGSVGQINTYSPVKALCGGNAKPCSGSYEVAVSTEGESESERGLMISSVKTSGGTGCLDMSAFYTVTLKHDGKAKIKDGDSDLTTLSGAGNCVKILTSENADGSKKWWKIDNLNIVDEQDNKLCKESCLVDNYEIRKTTTFLGEGGGTASSYSSLPGQEANTGNCDWLISPTHQPQPNY